MQPVRWVGARRLTGALLNLTMQHPIEFKPGSLGSVAPSATLRVSPQHRMLVDGDVLAPARGLLDLPGVRVVKGCRLSRIITSWAPMPSFRPTTDPVKPFAGADVPGILSGERTP